MLVDCMSFVIIALKCPCMECKSGLHIWKGIGREIVERNVLKHLMPNTI